MDKEMKTTTAPDANDSNRLGLAERSMLLKLTGPQPRLCYPTVRLSMLNGSVVEKYIISDTDKEKVLKKLYPFDDIPSMDSRMVDIHTDKAFIVKDFMVVREGDGNFLVSPYYAEAGGTVLDWMPADGRLCHFLQKEEEPEAENNKKLVVIVGVVKPKH